MTDVIYEIRSKIGQGSEGPTNKVGYLTYNEVFCPLNLMDKNMNVIPIITLPHTQQSGRNTT